MAKTLVVLDLGPLRNQIELHGEEAILRSLATAVLADPVAQPDDQVAFAAISSSRAPVASLDHGRVVANATRSMLLKRNCRSLTPTWSLFVLQALQLRVVMSACRSLPSWQNLLQQQQWQLVSIEPQPYARSGGHMPSMLQPCNLCAPAGSTPHLSTLWHQVATVAAGGGEGSPQNRTTAPTRLLLFTQLPVTAQGVTQFLAPTQPPAAPQEGVATGQATSSRPPASPEAPVPSKDATEGDWRSWVQQSLAALRLSQGVVDATLASSSGSRSSQGEGHTPPALWLLDAGAWCGARAGLHCHACAAGQVVWV